MSRLALAAALAAGSLLTLSAPALAGTTFPLGAGRFPDVVTLDDGTAHVAWVEPAEGGADRVHHCVVPRGARACATETVLAPPAGELGDLDLARGPGGALVLAVSGGDELDHLTFTPPAAPSDAGWRTAVGEADGGVAHVGGGVFVAAFERSTELRVQGFDSATGASGTSLALPLGFTAPTHVSVAVDPADGRPVVVADDSGNTQVVRYAGPLPADPVALTQPANWAAPVALSPVTSETSLGAGAGGLIAVGAAAPGGFPSALLARRVDAAPRAVAPAGAAVFVPTLDQHAGGNLYVAWRENDPAGGRLRFAKSVDGGARWSRAGDLLRESLGGSGNGIFHIRVGGAGDEQGLAVYEADTGATPAGTFTIRGVSLDLLPGDVPVGRTRAKGLVLSGPKVCVPTNGSFAAALKAGRGRLVQAVFSLDGRQKQADGAAPFRRTLNVKGLAPGSEHVLRAKATVGVAGTTVQRIVKRRLVVCG